jgi:HK97 family phage major capsid protein
MVMYDYENTLVWSRATVWPMIGEKMSFPKLNQNPDVEDANFDHFAGVSFTWTEEAGEPGDTEPSWGMIELIVHELAGYTEVSNTLLDDSAGVINLLNYLTILFRKAWYWVTDKAFLDGTGGKKPLGIINDPQVLTVNRQTSSTVEVQDFLNMEARLPAVFDPDAVWFISKKVRATIRGQKVSSTSDELVLQESFRDFSDGYPMTILGRPAFVADGKIPSMGNVGDVIFGAWPWYYIGDRKSFSLDTSKDYKFKSARTALRMMGRVDGMAAMPKAFCILGATS